MTSLLTEDCSRFLPPQHRTLDRRLLEDVSVAQLDPLTTQNANVVDLEDRRHAVDCQTDMLVRDTSDTETRVLPAWAWTVFALVYEANADSEVKVWPGHTYSYSYVMTHRGRLPTVQWRLFNVNSVCITRMWVYLVWWHRILWHHVTWPDTHTYKHAAVIYVNSPCSFPTKKRYMPKQLRQEAAASS